MGCPQDVIGSSPLLCPLLFGALSLPGLSPVGVVSTKSTKGVSAIYLPEWGDLSYLPSGLGGEV